MNKQLLTIGGLMLGLWLFMLGVFWLTHMKWYDPVRVIIFWSFGIASTAVLLTGFLKK